MTNESTVPNEKATEDQVPLVDSQVINAVRAIVSEAINPMTAVLVEMQTAQKGIAEMIASNAKALGAASPASGESAAETTKDLRESIEKVKEANGAQDVKIQELVSNDSNIKSEHTMFKWVGGLAVGAILLTFTGIYGQQAFNKAELKKDIADGKSDLRADLNLLNIRAEANRAELKSDITSVKVDLKNDLNTILSRLPVQNAGLPTHP